MARETEAIDLDPEVCSRGVEGVFDEESRGIYFVGDVNGRVVATTLITYEWSDWRNGTVWWIQSVYVVPEMRRQGIFNGLYDYIRRLSESDTRVRGIRLYVDRGNRRAQRVYARLGMNG